MSGAASMNTIEDIVFTDKADSVMVTFASGNTIELFGDGTAQRRKATEPGDIEVLTLID